jgi:hypothetical protein
MNDLREGKRPLETRLFLAIDNCFASKRWCEVPEWMRVIRDLGLTRVEASADNEIDPLYSCPEFLEDWIQQVRRESERTGVQVVNCYSGHGTYSTLGLAHFDPRVREHLRRNWVERMLRTAGSLQAGLGMFAHAFAERILRDRQLYEEAYGNLVQTLHDLSLAAEQAGVRTFGIEQMYTPHQVPWTIAGTDDFLRRTNAKEAGLPVYITLDTGHQSGQDRFLPPTARQIDGFAEAVRAGRASPIYLGPRECFESLRQRVLAGVAAQQLRQDVEAFVGGNPHLFSRRGDGDPYLWLEHYGAFSPIIHLQQTDGTRSAHQNFTAETAKTGIIHPAKVLRAIHASTSRPVPTGFPPPVREIHLTLEPFIGTAEHPRIALEQIAESVRYWRRYVPRDGMTVEQAILGLEAESQE